MLVTLVSILLGLEADMQFIIFPKTASEAHVVFAPMLLIRCVIGVHFF